MNPVRKEKGQFNIVGISVRTTNANEMTADAKIMKLWEHYYEQKVMNEISNPVNPSVTYGLYSDYENGVDGEYSITAGVQVDAYDVVPNGFIVKTIPAAKYMVFTSEKGSFSEVVFKLWQDIWSWFEREEVERAFTGDFEVYDERCVNPLEAQVDIYIAIKE